MGKEFPSPRLLQVVAVTLALLLVVQLPHLLVLVVSSALAEPGVLQTWRSAAGSRPLQECDATTQELDEMLCIVEAGTISANSRPLSGTACLMAGNAGLFAEVHRLAVPLVHDFAVQLNIRRTPAPCHGTRRPGQNDKMRCAQMLRDCIEPRRP